MCFYPTCLGVTCVVCVSFNRSLRKIVATYRPKKLCAALWSFGWAHTTTTRHAKEGWNYHSEVLILVTVIILGTRGSLPFSSSIGQSDRSIQYLLPGLYVCTLSYTLVYSPFKLAAARSWSAPTLAASFITYHFSLVMQGAAVRQAIERGYIDGVWKRRDI